MTAGQLQRKHSTEDIAGIRPEADVRTALGSTMLHENSHTSGLASFSELDWAEKHVSWPENRRFYCQSNGPMLCVAFSNSEKRSE